MLPDGDGLDGDVAVDVVGERRMRDLQETAKPRRPGHAPERRQRLVRRLVEIDLAEHVARGAPGDEGPGAVDGRLRQPAQIGGAFLAAARQRPLRPVAGRNVALVDVDAPGDLPVDLGERMRRRERITRRAAAARCEEEQARGEGGGASCPAHAHELSCRRCR